MGVAMDLKRKEYIVPLTPADVIDVKLFIKKNEVVKFSLNYRAEIEGVWYQVYRLIRIMVISMSRSSGSLPSR